MNWMAASLTLCLACAACATSKAKDPESVLRAYSQALEEGRAEEAYRMLSEEARRGISLEAFRRMVTDNPEEVREIARALARPTATPVVTATVTSATGQELELVLERGQWKVEATAIDLYAQDTPRHAIQGFLRAVERKRYDVVLKYVPDAHKEGLDASKLKAAWEGHDKEEMEQVVSALRQALPTATIEETGDRATMAYGAGTMQLVRERGLWKIEDFD
jgi:biotin synthase-like enzyme